ncbi:MAG: DUF134 domain-containing protein [Patescibacteria group bacterium]
MTKTKKKRVVRFDPKVTYFKPRGVPLAELEEVVLNVEELEAVRLANVEEFTQTEAAGQMEVSQSTFHRIISTAHQKLGKALINGCSIKVEGGDYRMPNGRGRGAGRGGRGRQGGPYSAGPGGTCVCTNCGHKEPHRAGEPCYKRECPECGSAMVRKREDN